MENKKKKIDKLNDKVEDINKAIDKKIAKVSDKLKKGGVNISKNNKSKNMVKETETKKAKTQAEKDTSSKVKVKKIDNKKEKKEPKNNLKKEIKNKSQKITNKIKSRRHPILIILTGIAIVILSIFLLFMLFIVITAPKFDENELYNREATIIYDAKGDEIGRIGSEKRELVSYDELPQVLIDAIVATEDSRFFQHSGFDLPRFTRAVVGQLSGNSSAGGASTLTMQIVKNTFTSKESHGIKGIIRKFTDIYMAIFKVEKNYTKEEIMEFYVNAPWLGNGTYGVEQACRLYFGKSVRDLNLAEASLIAGMFQAPSTHNPYNNPEQAAKRRKTVLKLMVRHGYITQEEADAANSISIESMLSAKPVESDNIYQGFIDTVIEDVQAKTGNDPYNTPMLIYTTMEKDAQDVINKLYAGEYYTWKNDVVQAGIGVTSVKDGSIVAVGAGRNRVGERQYNYATQMKRHPGSCAKPFFAYGPYLEYNNGNTGSIFFDEPMTYSDGTPLKNSDNSYMGMLTMKTALYRSRNIPAIQAFQQVDKTKVANFVHSLGIDYGDTLYESAAIGGFDGMSPMSMSAAYAAFGRGGYYIEPYSFTKIVYRQDDSTFEPEIKKNKVMSEETAYMMNNMLTYAGANNVGGKIYVDGTDVAAKTGTSTIDEAARKANGLPDSVSHDNWVEIYSPDYSISLWYGYKEITKDYYTTAIDGANQRVRISAALGNNIFKKNSRFQVPDGVVEAQVELGTNPAQKPSNYTPSSLISTEYFNKNSAPNETSPRFTKLNDPTNGSASTSGSAITLSWHKIETPNALNSTYLEDYMKNAYGDQYERYLKHMLSYNQSVLGNVGYEVFLKDPATGNLQDLGFTDSNTFTYTMSGQASYTFVIKSTYSNFKSNMSDGINIDVKGDPALDLSGGTTYGTGNKNNSDIELSYNNSLCAKPTNGGTWSAVGKINVKINNTIVSSSNITYNYYKGNAKLTTNYIPLGSEGTYNIEVVVKYGGKTYNTDKEDLVFKVTNTCTN